MASAYVFCETAVKRPTISTIRITAMVATTTAQISPRPNFAPASPEVAIVPASRKPPVAVTTPSASDNHCFFMNHPPAKRPRLLYSKPQPAHANRTMCSGTGSQPPVSPAYTDQSGVVLRAYPALLAGKATAAGQDHPARCENSQSWILHIDT